MPLHLRIMPQGLKQSIGYLESLVGDIEKEMDGVKLPKNVNRTRWQVASTSLYLATQHADAIILLVRRHDNDAAGLHLRSLFEIYIRLAYMLSRDDNSRLLAVLYADAVNYERYSKEVKKVNLDALTSVPDEAQNRMAHLNENVSRHIETTRTQERAYRRQLQDLNHIEFLNDKQKLKSGDSISQLLSIKYMCRNLSDNQGKNLLGEYASIYGNLSMYAHTSTVYLKQILHEQSDGNMRIGTVSDADNEEVSIRNIATAHHYLGGLFLQCLREEHRSQKELSSKLITLEDSGRKYDELMAAAAERQQ